MTRPIRRILVAVKDVRGRASRTLRKAARLARSMDAHLELFHAISDPIAADALIFANQGLEKLQAREQLRYLKQLERFAAPLRRNGLVVSTAVEWDYPAHEALIRRARRTGVDLIIAERHAGKHLAAWILRYTDWELLRQSPVPVLLVKTNREYDSPNVLAAVDPAHAFDKTARLDSEILRIGARICAATRGRLHVVHAYVPTLMDASPAQLSSPDASGQIVMHAATRANARLDKALRSARLGKLGPDRRHVLARHPADAIPELVRRLDCDIVIMGALSRSGLKRIVIGDTAERLLDDLPCDLLIVKPPAFVSRVSARSRGPQLVAISPIYGTV